MPVKFLGVIVGFFVMGCASANALTIYQWNGSGGTGSISGLLVLEDNVNIQNFTYNEFVSFCITDIFPCTKEAANDPLDDDVSGSPGGIELSLSHFNYDCINSGGGGCSPGTGWWFSHDSVSETYTLVFFGGFGGQDLYYEGNSQFLLITAIPLPSALPLFAAALGGLGLTGWVGNARHRPH